MRLTDALSADRIVLDLQAQTKDEAIAELIHIAATGGDVDETPAQLQKLVLEREALTSTAVDKGVAIPHARSGRIKGIVVSLGIHRQGLDFGSPDGDPVHLVFLVLSADTTTPAYLSILGRTARIFRRPQMLQSVLDATGVDAILQSIAAHEPV
ncbi:MAG: PTS sugar transporter subunit IIA [Gemmatimonadetes bacterium]|jgi:mannitol/fructose-specific phosphotransferase system IIA component (Ntr-type)|nr:PTS sugar transporter subunit IIA [Gemmatimonadota bacterium]MBT6145819.1 PTS sugar transporter subunit IIA [Gemmatimonadota bacterium]MBT7860033.1 PTS sugar transporter subunit IIA [Gemmatimonadota bacterium]